MTRKPAQTSWAAIISCLILHLSTTNPSQAGHSASECQIYARNAVNQYNALRSTGCAAQPGAKIWSDNYNEHYAWCTSSDGDLGQEFKKRRLAIENCQRHSDTECNKYATNAVNQTREAVRKSCPNIGPPRWNENFQTHFAWCKSDIHGDLGQEFKQRRLALEACARNGASRQNSPTISAEVVFNASGQRVLRVAGSGFPNDHTVTISYKITQSRPGALATESSSSFNVVSKNNAIFGEVAVSCPAGFGTTFSNIDARDISTNLRVIAPGNRGC